MSIQLSPLFCDHMVLPARKPIRVYGSGSPDGIRVSLNGLTAPAVGTFPVCRLPKLPSPRSPIREGAGFHSARLRLRSPDPARGGGWTAYAFPYLIAFLHCESNCIHAL